MKTILLLIILFSLVGVIYIQQSNFKDEMKSKLELQELKEDRDSLLNELKISNQKRGRAYLALLFKNNKRLHDSLLVEIGMDN